MQTAFERFLQQRYQRRIFLLFLALTAFSPVVLASETATNPNACFAELSKLGAPDVTKATYVKLDRCWDIDIEDMLDYSFPTSGNAWMLSESRQEGRTPKKASFLINGMELLEFTWRPDGAPPVADPLQLPRSPGSSPQACWSKARLSCDIQTTKGFLRWVKNEEFPEIYCKPHVCGRLVLFAQQINQLGKTEDARQIFSELILRLGSQEKVTAAGINAVADAQHYGAYRTFLETYDWSAYRENLKALLAKFKGRWNSEGGIKLLLDAIERRLSKPDQKTSSLEALSPEDRILAAKMLKMRDLRLAPKYGDSSMMWLVPSSWRTDSQATDPDLLIRSKGLNAIPFLLALKNDEALTECDASTVFQDSNRRFSIREGNEDPNHVFSRIERPATRGEVAIRILREILPKTLTKEAYQDDALLEVAKTYYEQRQKATDAEIAIMYLPKDYGWNQQALSFLLEKTQSVRIPEFERFLLQKENMDHYNFPYHLEQKALLFAQYVALRGSEVQPLVEKFVQVLRQQSAEYRNPKNTSYGGEEQDKAHVAQGKAKILSLAENVASLQAPSSLEELLARPESSPYKAQMLTAKFQVMSHSETLGILLRWALKTPESLNTAHTLIRSVLIEDRHGPLTDVKPTEYAAEWNAVISKSQDFLKDYEILFASPLANPPRINRLESWDRSQSSVENVVKDLCAEHGPLATQLIKQRVEARLAGTAEEHLPKYPCDRPFSATEIAGLTSKFAGATSRETAQEIVSKLSIYEHEALPTFLLNNPELNARLLKYNRVITAVNLPEQETKLHEKFSPLINTDLTLEILRSLETLVKTEGEAGRGITGIVSSKKNFAGCEISVKRFQLVDQEGKPQKLCGYAGFVCGFGVYAQAVWRITTLPKKIWWYTIQTSEPMDLAAFDKALLQFIGTGIPASKESFIRFMAKGESQE